uniref:Uncharacterized protein n=1 Tax=Triticum urartu TaxID=4572 RepID=A0A8R7TJG6_TRIUA
MPQATLPFMAGDPSSPLPPLFILRCSPCPRRRSHSWPASRSFSLRHALRWLMHHMRRGSTHDVFKKGGPVGT